MKALITGGAGFIGSHLADLLVEEGHEVIICDDLSSGNLSNLKVPHTFHHVDICDQKALLPLFEGVGWVFHLAGKADIVPSIENPQNYFRVNVEGTLNVLECAKKAGVQKVLYAASSSCYGIPKEYPTKEDAPIDPQYPYALTKRLGEELVMHWESTYSLPALSLRLFNVYGPRARSCGTYGAVFGVFLSQKLHQKPMTVVGDGSQTRDFTYVTDVARAFYLAAQSSLSGEIFNVGSGSHVSIQRLVELLGGESVSIPERPGEPACTFADVRKIEKHLGWRAKVPFEEGVERLLKEIESFREAPLWEPHSIAKATEKWFLHLERKTCSESK